jgi:hypothetical protein
VDVDGEELVLSVNGLPGCDEWLAACGPSCVGGVNTTRVEFEFGSGKDLICVCGAANVGFVETEDGRVV